MAHTKPQVIIDLEEYNELLQTKKKADTDFSKIVKNAFWLASTIYNKNLQKTGSKWWNPITEESWSEEDLYKLVNKE